MLGRLLFWCTAAAALAVAAFVLINTAIVAGEQRHMYARVEDVPERKVAIVLGAAVLRSGQLSAVFLDRVNVALELYRAGKVQNILVSGGNSTVENNEVTPAKNYLVSQGVPQEDIYLDHAGFDTYSTMYRAREVFGVTGAIVATQSFHLPRALFLARTMGIDAVGLRSDNVHLLARNDVRESLARVKALWEVAARREPKFLGEKIPII